MRKTKSKILLTKKGYKKLREEYEYLVGQRRLEVAEKIQEALEMGDVSENAAYQTAKEEQAYLEGRIAELEEIFRNADVVSTAKDENGCVTIGSKVQVHVEGSRETFWIVGAHEADPASGKISHESPIGQALLGRKVGDEVEVEAPVGKLVYRIEKIE